ncbi:hypothetical protein D5086_005502 [Populus alba]|uniref:Uncharacterized protein n=1 Tax=Populus alba TaxID=43335 RepID=A0ACC4CUZ7_POPAL
MVSVLWEACTRALISFDSAEDMMAALQVDTQAWKNDFDELRPRTQTDGPNDRLISMAHNWKMKKMMINLRLASQAQAAFVTECRSEVDTFDVSFDQHRG